MRCSNCGVRFAREGNFCSNCGAERHSTTGKPDDRQRLRRRSTLADDDEEIIWSGSFSARGLIHSWLLATIVTVVLPLGGSWVGATREEWMIIGGILVLIWLGLGGLLAFQKLNVRYVLTNQRLIHRSGILFQRTDRLELIDMNDVSHAQSIVERMFNVGTIEVTTTDRSHPYIELPGINNVEGVAMLIDDARLRERSRRSVHVEQI